jgi:hypothetical protein
MRDSSTESTRDSSRKSNKSIINRQLFSRRGLKRCLCFQTFAAERKDFNRAAKSAAASECTHGEVQEGRVVGRKRGSRSQEFSNLKVVGRGMVVEAVTRRGT